MDKLEMLFRRAQSGDREAEIALLAIFHDEIRELSKSMKNPQEAFDTLRSEFLLEVKSGKLHNMPSWY